MIKAVDREFAEKWLAKARRDLIMARKALTGREPFTDMACFHAQQAVEKSLKGVLTLHGITFEKTHALKPLLISVEKMCPAMELDQATVAAFSSYGVMVRYPGWIDDPSVEDARSAIGAAANLLKLAKKHIKDTGLTRSVARPRQSKQKTK